MMMMIMCPEILGKVKYIFLNTNVCIIVYLFGMNNSTVSVPLLHASQIHRRYLFFPKSLWEVRKYHPQILTLIFIRVSVRFSDRCGDMCHSNMYLRI